MYILFYEKFINLHTIREVQSCTKLCVGVGLKVQVVPITTLFRAMGRTGISRRFLENITVPDNVDSSEIQTTEFFLL